MGQHPLVTQLLKGMFNNRPPRPRYSHTWDVASVTKYLASLGNKRLLSLKKLSFKLAMLFCLTCPERVSALTKLDLRHCRVLPEGVEFTLSAPRKRGSTDQLPKAVLRSFSFQLEALPGRVVTFVFKGYAHDPCHHPILQGGSAVHLLCETSQADHSHVSREVAAYATEGLWY